MTVPEGGGPEGAIGVEPQDIHGRPIGSELMQTPRMPGGRQPHRNDPVLDLVEKPMGDERGPTSQHLGGQHRPEEKRLQGRSESG